MTNKKTLLEVRKESKKFKPAFKVKESNFVARIKVRWRFPGGRHSKVRQYHCGRPALPTPGYGSPREVRGLSRIGLKSVVVHNTAIFNSLDNKTDGIVIGSTVGNRKRLGLLKLAKEKGFTLLNVKNIDQAIDKISKKLEERKKIRTERSEVKTKKQKEKERKAEEKQRKEAEEKKKEDNDHGSSEEKETQERKEMEKLITKKQ